MDGPSIYDMDALRRIVSIPAFIVGTYALAAAAIAHALWWVLVGPAGSRSRGAPRRLGRCLIIFDKIHYAILKCIDKGDPK